MVVPRPSRRARAWTLALLGVLWAVIAPRPALAYGCHVDERPRLELSEFASRHGLDSAFSSPPANPSRWAARPCPSDVPNSPERPVPIGPGLVSVIDADAPAPGRESPRAVDALRPGRDAWADLARPPRLG